MALTFTPGSYAVEIVRDRASGTRRLLAMFGLRSIVYWLASLASDMSAYGFLGIAALIVGKNSFTFICFKTY